MSKSTALRLIKRRARLEELKRVKKVNEVYGAFNFPGVTQGLNPLERRIASRSRARV